MHGHEATTGSKATASKAIGVSAAGVMQVIGLDPPAFPERDSTHVAEEVKVPPGS
ncbi:hypothetical protein [Streptomyces sp. 150FB]|uniref:hypothetical protein n=1 Tax=Streptomyces sp. 150FB TaxID=1576605 RepID=UPI000A6D1DBE|nr:hypothetical protein [Streptomyces sp. 150FB]